MPPPPARHDDRITVTVPEVARLLGINRTTAYDLVNSGRIPHVRIGRLIRVPRAALDHWLQEEACSSVKPDREGTATP